MEKLEIDYVSWGYASGNYPVFCLDCPKGIPINDRPLGSISSNRCLYHAALARTKEENMSPTQKVQDTELSLGDPDYFNDVCSYRKSSLIVASLAFAIWFVVGAAAYGVILLG